MKILFSNPPFWVKEGDAPLRQGIRAGSRWPFTRKAEYAPDDYRFGTYMPFPFFLASAAGWLENNLLFNMAIPRDGKVHQVEVRDSIARGESYDSFGKYLAEHRPDWVVIETATTSWEHDQRILRIIRVLLPEVKMVVVGTISANEGAVKDALAIDGVVAVVKGEYEKGVVRVIANGERGVIPHDFLSAEEMNGRFSQWPKWDIDASKNYFDACPKGQRPPQLQMWASRGCPHVCNFCQWPAYMTNNDPLGLGKRKVRFYTPEWVEGYIRHRQNVMGKLGCVYFDDDTFNLGDKHVTGICEVMKKLHLPWFAMCRADSVSRDVWMKMRDAGCEGVKIGFESGSDRVVNRIIGKKLDLVEAADTAVWLRSIGLSVHGTFMVGLPGETSDERQMTHDFIRELYKRGGLDTHQLSGTAEIDGTPLSNLKAGEVQKNFPDAKKDENYIPSKDGLIKAEMLSNSLIVRK